MAAMKNTLLAEVSELSASIETAVRSGNVSLSVPVGEQDDVHVESLVFDIEAASRRVVQTDGE
jgi:hypothetical protein